MILSGHLEFRTGLWWRLGGDINFEIVSIEVVFKTREGM
jgi:hypothetical protein